MSRIIIISKRAAQQKNLPSAFFSQKEGLSRDAFPSTLSWLMNSCANTPQGGISTLRQIDFLQKTKNSICKVLKSEGVDHMSFEPKIVAFCCNWCSYAAADLAGTARMQYPHNVRIIRVMCSGMVHPEFVMDALSQGADGVMVLG